MRNDATPHWGALGTVLWAGGILALTFAAQAIVVMLVILLRQPNPSEEEFGRLVDGAMSEVSVIVFATLVSAAISCACVAAAIKLKAGTTVVAYLGLHPFARRSLLPWAQGLGAFIVASALLGHALGQPSASEFDVHLFATAQPLWMLWLMLVVAAPVSEEFLFRGFMLSGLARSAIGPAGAVVATALPWAAIHLQYDLYGMACIFVLGLILGAARLRSGSLWLPMILHALLNLMHSVGMTLWMR